MRQAQAAGAPAVTHRDVLAIALPIVASNVTTPLVGLVDTAVIGQTGEPALIAGVAIGTMIFSLLFWSFGFLRMGTSGLTAQADGAGNAAEITATLQRALVIALVLGAIIVAMKDPICDFALLVVEGSTAAEAATRTYFGIRCWGGMAILANYALLGWFIGLGKAGTAFALQLLLNGVNLALSIILVLGFDFGVAGVGIAALVAEIVAVLAGLVLAYVEVKRRGDPSSPARIFDRVAMGRMINVNRDILIRTLAMMLTFSFFTAQGAKSGDVLLAANTILMDFFAVTAYFLDGFSHAAETLVGRAVGGQQRQQFIAAARVSSLWAVATSVVVTLALIAGGGAAIDAMTTSPEVRATARDYLLWAAFTPVAGVAAFQLDGIFIGATRTADMRNMMILSVGGFFLAWLVLAPMFGNHGLWASLIAFLLIRAVTLAICVPSLLRGSFPAKDPTVRTATPR